jgi:hypothetical protein
MGQGVTPVTCGPPLGFALPVNVTFDFKMYLLTLSSILNVKRILKKIYESRLLNILCNV